MDSSKYYRAALEKYINNRKKKLDPGIKVLNKSRKIFLAVLVYNAITAIVVLSCLLVFEMLSISEEIEGYIIICAFLFPAIITYIIIGRIARHFYVSDYFHSDDEIDALAFNKSEKEPSSKEADKRRE